MRIARCLGVRTSGAELRRLRDAAAVWRQQEEEHRNGTARWQAELGIEHGRAQEGDSSPDEEDEGDY